MHLSTKELILCALFIALITVGTFIKIPVGTDVYTLQFLFTLLAGLLLGPRLGAIAVGTYVVMGLVGIPVFASGGGPGYIAQPTFGYLLGFIVQAWVNGAWARKAKQINFRSLLEANLVGMVIVYLFGLVWFYVVSNYISMHRFPCGQLSGTAVFCRLFLMLCSAWCGDAGCARL